MRDGIVAGTQVKNVIAGKPDHPRSWKKWGVVLYADEDGALIRRWLPSRKTHSWEWVSAYTLENAERWVVNDRSTQRSRRTVAGAGVLQKTIT